MQNFIVVDRIVKHLGIGLEAHGGAGAVGLAHHVDMLQDIAAGKAHLMDLSVLVDLDLQPLGQGVDHRGTHAVQAAGALIASAAELAARVQHGKDDLQGRLAGLLLDVHRDAAAVIGDANDIALLNAHLNVGAVAGQGLVDGVVDDLIDQVMQTGRGGGPDVHTGALAHRFQTFQHLNLTGVIFLADFFRNIRHICLPCKR